MFTELVSLFFVGVLLFNIVTSIGVFLTCRMLEKIPNTDYENEKKRENSWTGPVRSSYIVITATWLMFIVSSILLASGEKIMIVLGVALTIFSIMILGTTFMFAFAVIYRKRNPMSKKKNFLFRLPF